MGKTAELLKASQKQSLLPSKLARRSGWGSRIRQSFSDRPQPCRFALFRLACFIIQNQRTTKYNAFFLPPFPQSFSDNSVALQVQLSTRLLRLSHRNQPPSAASNWIIVIEQPPQTGSFPTYSVSLSSEAVAMQDPQGTTKRLKDDGGSEVYGFRGLNEGFKLFLRSYCLGGPEGWRVDERGIASLIWR